jgi:hypothetical protein
MSDSDVSHKNSKQRFITLSVEKYPKMLLEKVQEHLDHAENECRIGKNRFRWMILSSELPVM